MSTERFSHVLVVEDSEPERLLLCEILQDEGFQVVGCGSANEGLQQIQRRQFGVAIIDLHLPDRDGTQLLGQIHGLDEQVQVIIHTGAASFDSVKDAINLGAFAYVEKLRDPGELLRQVHRAFSERIHGYAKDLEAAVRQRTEQLARSNRELESFASVVAHDLRSPLLTISGYGQILQEEYKSRLDDTACQYIAHIVEGVARMNRLIEDLLSYSRVGRSAEPFRPVPLDLVLRETIENLQAAINDSGAQVDVGPMPVLPGVRTQLLQLFQNLIGNAIKFHREAAPTVRVRASREATCWQFAVEDNGIGIDAEHFDRIFQVFQRLHGQEYPGTGIGLALCKKIVEVHGGRIWLTSQAGAGTTFCFTLPDTRGIGDSPTRPVIA